jgi:hypothetical protein
MNYRQKKTSEKWRNRQKKMKNHQKNSPIRIFQSVYRLLWTQKGLIKQAYQSLLIKVEVPYLAFL